MSLENNLLINQIGTPLLCFHVFHYTQQLFYLFRDILNAKLNMCSTDEAQTSVEIRVQEQPWPRSSLLWQCQLCLSFDLVNRGYKRQLSLIDVNIWKTVHLIFNKMHIFVLWASLPLPFPSRVLAIVFIKYAICPTSLYSSLVNNLHHYSDCCCVGVVMYAGLCHTEIQTKANSGNLKRISWFIDPIKY